MANKKPEVTGKSFNPSRWVACELSASDKKHLKTVEVSFEQLLTGLSRLIDDGYRLSMGFETKNDAVGVYLTAPKDPTVNYTMCLSARAPTLEKALVVLSYKHFEMLKGDWSGHVDKSGAIDPWG